MEDDRFTRITLRIPRDLHAQLQASADQKSHSMNAEIVARLESSFSYPQGQNNELLNAQRKTIQSQETTILMLQAYMVDVIQALPPKLRTDERIKVASSFLVELDPEQSQSEASVPGDIPVTVRGKKMVIRRQAQRSVVDHGELADSGSENHRVVIVGNLGRQVDVQNAPQKAPPNKGPIRSKNARKPIL